MGAQSDPARVSNPLLDLWFELHPRGSDIMSMGVDGYLTSHRARLEATTKYAWAVPTPAAIDAIAACGPIVEIGAGTGYWASLLAARGVDVVAYDIDPPRGGLEANHWHKGATLWHPVAVGGPEMVARHPDRTLFLCWPPYDQPMGAECLEAYRGQRVIYVGEGSGGCTGDDRFHELLERDFPEEVSVWLPQWPGIHDYLEVRRRLAVVR